MVAVEEGHGFVEVLGGGGIEEHVFDVLPVSALVFLFGFVD